MLSFFFLLLLTSNRSHRPRVKYASNVFCYLFAIVYNLSIIYFGFISFFFLHTVPKFDEAFHVAYLNVF